MFIKPRFAITAATVAASVVLAACGALQPAAPEPSATPEPSVTTTPDACAPENLTTQVEGIHRIMREFDDAVALASSITRDLLPDRIEELQRIRREAEDLRPPSCLQSLKDLQLVHMNTVIQTMLAFMNGADEETVSQGLNLGRQIHNQYMIEMARAMGSTPEAVALPAFGGLAMPTVVDGTVQPTPSVPVVSNPGPAPVNLRINATLDGQTLGMLDVGGSALALGRSVDGFWTMVEVPGLPGQVAWVYTALVQIAGPAETLPIVAP